MTMPRTTVAPARSSARHSSVRHRAAARPELAPSTGSAPAPMQAPTRNDRSLQSLLHPLRRALRGLCGGAIRLRAVIILPMSLLLKCVRYILGHVGLVLFGKHGIGAKYAGRIECALGDYALPFAEQVRQKARIRHRQFGAAIGDLEGNGEVVATLERTWLHQTAEPEPPARQDMLLSDHGGRREEHDGIAHGVEHQSCRERQYRKRAADDRQSPLLTRHGVYPSSPRFFRPSLSRRNRSASFATASRASASALFALSRSPITI